MSSIRFSIAPSVVETFPSIYVAGLRASVENPAGLRPVMSQLRGKITDIRAQLRSFDHITSVPEIACWREAYARMEVKPSKFPSSIEALLRRVAKESEIETGIEIVDLYNLVSIISKTPIGAYDARKLKDRDIRLRHAQPAIDRFQPLGGSAEHFPLKPSLVVYGSEDSIFCWGFNTRDSREVCIDEHTKDIVFLAECATSDRRPPTCHAMSSLAQSLRAGGVAVADVVDFDASRREGTL